MGAAGPGDPQTRGSFPGRRSCRQSSCFAATVLRQRSASLAVPGGGRRGLKWPPRITQQTCIDFQNQHLPGPNSGLSRHTRSEGDSPDSADGAERSPERPHRTDTCCPAPEEPRKSRDRQLDSRPTGGKQSGRQRSQGPSGLLREEGKPLD